MTSMPKIDGSRLRGRDVPKFVWNADLVTYDGPLISLFKHEDDDYLFVWEDCDDASNRWLIFSIQKTDLRAYLTAKKTLRKVFDTSMSIFIMDIRADSGRRSFWNISRPCLPNEYLPSDGSFLTEELKTESAGKLAAELPSDYILGLDGDIYLDDLASIPKLYQQLYSFHYGLAHLDRPAVNAALSKLTQRWHGGINAVNMFNGLRSVTPSIHRAQVVAINFNSPGKIKLELLSSLAAHIKNAIFRITPPENFKSSEKFYKRMYKYFSDEDLRGFDTESFSRSQFLTKEQKADLDTFIDEFCQLMQWETQAIDLSSLDLDPLSKMRILLAYYRRLRGLRRYVSQQKLTLS